MHTFSRSPITISSLSLLTLFITILCSSLTVRSSDPLNDLVGSAKDTVGSVKDTVGSALNETSSLTGNVINTTSSAYNYTKNAAEYVAHVEDSANGAPTFLPAGQGPLALVSAVLIGLSLLF